MMLEVVMGEVDKAANEVADIMTDMEVDKVCNMVVRIPIEELPVAMFCTLDPILTF